MLGLNTLATFNTGGILWTAAANVQGGRITGGGPAVVIGTGLAQNTALSSNTLFLNANAGTSNFFSQVIDSGYQSMNVVKNLTAGNIVFGVQPNTTITATTAHTAGTTPGVATTGSTTGLVAGMIINNAAGGLAANSLITTINSGTQYASSGAVTAASSQTAAAGYMLPTSSVITNVAAASFTGSTVTVPVGSVIYPGSTVTLATGTGGATVALGTVTVRSYNATTGVVTLSAAPTTTPTAVSTLIFGPPTSTSSAITPTGGVSGTAAASTGSGTAYSQTITLASGTNSLMLGAAVTGTGIAAGSTIIAITSPTTFRVGSTVAGAGGAPADITITTPASAASAQSLVTQTTSGSTTATVIGSATSPLFVGQQITGPGIPYGTTVQGISPVAGSSTNFVVTLSQAATTTGQANQFFSLGPVGSSIVATTIAAGGGVTVPSTAGLAVGMSVSGTGIPAGSVIGSITGSVVNLVNSSTGAAATLTASSTPTAVTFSAPLQAQFVTSSGSTVASVTATGTATVPSGTSVVLASAANLAVGMFVRGPGIPNGTTITAISGSTITLSASVNTTANTASVAAANGAYTFYLPSTYSEAFTGTFYANGGTTTIGGVNQAAGAIQIPGNLVINNGATVTQSTNNGSISASSNVTINGGGVLTLTGHNTLASLTINNNGGTATPTVTPGAAGNILFLTNPVINVTSDNAASTATIGTGTLNFGDAPTFNTSTNTPERLGTDLLVNSVITNTIGFGWQPAANGTNPLNLNATLAGGFSSYGTVSLGGVNTFSNGVVLNNGTLVVTAATTTVTAGVVVSGQFGTGSLTLAGGTTIVSDTNRTVSNVVNINGNITFGGTLSTNNNVTMQNVINLGAATRTLTVTYPGIIATLSGGINSSGNAGITKEGNGTLALGGGMNYLGDTTINLGRVAASAAFISRSRFVLAANSQFDLNAGAATIGSLSGSGLVTSSAAARILTIGNDNSNQTFSGVITNLNATNTLALTKIGTGTQTLTNKESFHGALVINNGGLTLSGDGSLFNFYTGASATPANTLNAGGTLTIDNTAANVANRFGGTLYTTNASTVNSTAGTPNAGALAQNLTMTGGTLIVNGNASASLNENIGTLTLNGGLSTITLNPGAGGTNNLKINIYTYTSGSLFMSGSGLGLNNANSNGAANVTVLGTAPGMVNGILATTAGGAYAFGDDGTNKGFLTYDASRGFRVLTTADLGVFPTQPVFPTQTGITNGLTSTITSVNNVGVSSAVYLTQDSTINSLTLRSGGSIITLGGNLVTAAGAPITTSGSLYAADGTPVTAHHHHRRHSFPGGQQRHLQRHHRGSGGQHSARVQCHGGFDVGRLP